MTPEQFKEGYDRFVQQEGRSTKRFALNWDLKFPILDNDKYTSFEFPRDYIYLTGWAARVLKKINPSYHHDFASSLYFISMVSAWLPIKFCDYRRCSLQLDNLTCAEEDLRSLSFADNSLGSVSCLHVLEHIGLGRYGDEIDYDGDLKAIRELKRVVRPGGHLLLAVPVGRTAAVCFNAHRIYGFREFITLFDDGFELIEDVLIPESPLVGLVPNPPEDLLVAQRMACGCYWFRKR